MVGRLRKGTVDARMFFRLIQRSGGSRGLRTKLLVALLGTVLAHALHTPLAFAQQDTEKRVQGMNKRAMADYDALEFEMSRKTLMDAVSLMRQAGIDETPTAARTYLNLGIVYVSGFKDRNRGMQQFIQALKINPALKIDPAVATPEIDEVFAAAKKQVGAGTPVKEPTKEPDLPVERPGSDDVKGLAHSPVDEAKPGEPLLIKAQLGTDAGASRVYVLYRVSGQADYTPIAMKHNGGGEWSAVIPGEEIQDRPIQYYLEARDRKGRVVIGSGSAPNPYIVTLAETAPGARIVHREDPRTTSRKKEEDKNHFHRLFVFLMPGVGIGYHPAGNTTEVAWQKSDMVGGDPYKRASVKEPGGVALAPFHLSVEVGGMVTRHFSLSLIGRFQAVTGSNAQTYGTEMGNEPVGGTTKAGGAVAGFLRARYRFLDGKFHPYLHVDIGGGEIRHALDLTGAQGADSPLVDEATARAQNMDPSAKIDRQLVCSPNSSCYDSLKLGYLFIGGGAGVWYDVWKYIGLILDVNVLGGIGVSGGQSGMNIDVQLGIGAHFL